MHSDHNSECKICWTEKKKKKVTRSVEKGTQKYPNELRVCYCNLSCINRAILYCKSLLPIVIRLAKKDSNKGMSNGSEFRGSYDLQGVSEH